MRKTILFFMVITLITSIDKKTDKRFKSFYSKDEYPIRGGIKGIQPDNQNYDNLIGNKVQGVAFNFVWIQWQSVKSQSCSEGQVNYDGYCYTVLGSYVNDIRTYTDAGVVVTGVFYGVPDWGRRQCNNVNQMFCAPTEEASQDFGRFVGFIAWYFNGENGNGRVADFVIHNEVNAAEWFNYGCGANTCDVDYWTTVYAQSYNPAYDYVKKEQKNAKVLISFEHCFGSELDGSLAHDPPVVSVETFLGYVIPKIGEREWKLAFHSYPIDLLSPVFGPRDYPYITFGNIGVLSGWLRRNYPSKPHAWEIELTENGINGNGAEMHNQQSVMLCQAFRNILGTPDVTNFIYHRLHDHPDETKYGLALGLWDENGAYKPAWSTWALANRDRPDCGFEYLPYIKLIRGLNPNTIYHWVTSRQLPDGYNEENSWKVLREPTENSKILYECKTGEDTALLSEDPNCEGQFNMGPIGYIYTENVEGTVGLYRCYSESNGDHFVSGDPGCEGLTTERLLGYVYPN